MTTLITHIGELVAVPPGPVPGPAMDRVPRMPDAAVLIEGDRIAWVGPGNAAPDADETFDAAGGCVVPGLVDCHTHAVFAGTREQEFVKRIRGKTYHQIAEEGGGIRTTVESVRFASEHELIELALPRLRRMLEQGVTTIEIKSGYGLTPADEIKMLRAARALSVRTPLEIITTYLAAHTVPRDYVGRPDEYLRTVFNDDVLTTVRKDGLADFCDVFCEKGAFTVEQARFALRAAARYSLRPKVHADQLSQIGASRLAAELGAVSADHLEFVDQPSIAAMNSAGTIPVLLPGCSFFLDTPPAPARRLIDAGLPVALATDLNPGSSMIESLPLIMSIACVRLRMTPVEALVACTANAAAAVDRHRRLGSLAVGHQADLVVLDVATVDAWPYHVGRNCVRAVIKGGRVVVNRTLVPAPRPRGGS
jgi:imidazolonepropionase